MNFENPLDVVEGEGQAELLAACIEQAAAGPTSYSPPPDELTRLHAAAWAELGEDDDGEAGTLSGPADGSRTAPMPEKAKGRVIWAAVAKSRRRSCPVRRSVFLSSAHAATGRSSLSLVVRASSS